MPEITIKALDGGEFKAYHAAPKGKSGPGLLLIQEIFGVNKVMRDLADEYAAEGYNVLCPDIFWRQEPGVQLTDKSQEEWNQAFTLMKGFNESKGIEDLIATVNTLREMPGSNGRVGTVGYCLGGRLAYLMATRSNSDANVSYYGVGLDNVLEEATAITKPVMLHIASEDKFVPKDAQEKIVAAMGKITHATVHVYQGVDHAFARVGGDHYDVAAAKQANGRTSEFLQANLG